MQICNRIADLHKNGAFLEIFLKNQVCQRINLKFNLSDVL